MSNKAGLYIHIPFCFSKCPYCDFYSGKYCETDAVQYIEKVISQMGEFENTEFDTVYFGGGTPSVIPYTLIEKILNNAKKHFKIDKDSEITIECNPGDDINFLADKYAEMGINRVSLGLQSANDTERRLLGRRAGANEIQKAVLALQNAGISNISVDLMLGIPEQTTESLKYSIDFISSLNIKHISAYMLKVEYGTKFFEMQKKGKLVLPSEDETCDFYLKTVEMLENNGFYQYEISNFSKPNFESLHNLKYWQLDNYLGLGATAHSFFNNERFFFNENLEKIFEGYGGDEDEKIMLGLRLKKGINKKLLKKDFQKFVDLGYIKENGENIFLTPKGMLISNYIISELI